MLGAVTPGDGGGGTFFYDISSLENENDGTIVKPTAVTGAGRWKRIYSGTLNVKWFASKVVSGNWSPAFQEALNIGQSIFVPQGGYRIDTTLTNIGDVSLMGETSGATHLEAYSDITILDFKSDAVPGHQFAFDIQGLSFVSYSTQASGAAIKLTWNAGGKKLGLITNVKILRDDLPHSFKYGIKVVNPQELVIRDVIIEGSPSSIGVDFTSNQSSVASILENVKIYKADIGFQISSGAERVEGLKLLGCDFTDVNKGIALSKSGPGLNVTSCHFNAHVGCISISEINQVFITDTLFYMDGPSSYGIGMNLVNDVSVSHCQFFKQFSGTPYGILCNNVHVPDSTDIKVTHNHFELDPTGGQTAIWFGNSCSRSQAFYNTVKALSTGFDVVNTGSNNIVTGNVKY